MTSKQEIERIARGLSGAQRAYFDAVGNSDGPYKPRHGTTANWALRHGYVVMLWKRIEDGKAVPWSHLPSEKTGEAMGCAFTQMGEALRACLQEQEQ